MPRSFASKAVRCRLRVATLAWAVLAVAGAATATRADMIDQSNTATVTQFFNTSPGTFSNLPIGQEFTPTLTSLNFVDLHIDDVGSDIGPGADFQVNIRSGTINGTIVGTSSTTFVPDNTNLGGGGNIITRLSFPTAVTLVPGNVYVIDVVQLAPFVPGNANFGIDGNFGNTYAPGRAIIAGTPNTDFDFFFREGIAVPEPGSFALVAIGSLGLLAYARRRKAPAA
jgi:hypothetical protein